MKKTKAIATCGLMTALSVVLMIVGHIINIGIYAAPMLAGICLLIIEKNYGTKYQIAVWMSVSTLSFILLPNVEENLMYLCIFGFYPIIRKYFVRLGKLFGIIIKILYFNVIFIAIELLLIFVLVPEATDIGFLILMLVLGNFMFLVYDLCLPRMEYVVDRYLSKIIKF